MKRRIKSRPGLFGMTYHYDENGRCVGKSRPSLFGGRTEHYSADGEHIGSSRPGFFHTEVFRDKKNDRRITGQRGLFGTTYREKGKVVGKSRPGIFGVSYTTLDVEEEDW